MLLKKIANRTWKPVVTWYLRKPRQYSFSGIHLYIPVGVFHPRFFFSTKFFATFLEHQPLRDLIICEMGCGSGLLALTAARKGAHVTAVDLFPAAVVCTKQNAEKNKLKLTVVASNLFEQLDHTPFDRIVVNPPYFKKNPTTLEQHAWYCGEQLEYFHSFFKQATTHLQPHGLIWMVLSNECDIEGISALAMQNGFERRELIRKKIAWEENYIFEFQRTS